MMPMHFKGLIVHCNNHLGFCVLTWLLFDLVFTGSGTNEAIGWED